MGVMSNQQRVAARRAMNRYPTLKPDLVEGETADEITPYVIADPTRRGATVSVYYGEEPSSIEQRLIAACQELLNGG